MAKNTSTGKSIKTVFVLPDYVFCFSSNSSIYVDRTERVRNHRKRKATIDGRKNWQLEDEKRAKRRKNTRKCKLHFQKFRK
jgi:hypothetical protein